MSIPSGPPGYRDFEPHQVPREFSGAVGTGGPSAGWGGISPTGWARIAALAAVIAAGTLVGLVDRHPAQADRRTSLNTLAAGECYNFPAGATVKEGTGDDGSDDYPSTVDAVPCDRPHRGEVVLRKALDSDGIRTSTALTRTAQALCGPAFADYVADRWALPQNVTPVAIYPAYRELNEHPVAVCILDDDGLPTTGSVRSDQAKLPEAQRAYLRAARPYNVAVGAWLDPDGAADLKELVGWAQDMAMAEHQLLDALPRLTVPAEARPSLATLTESHRKALAAWTAAAAAGSRADAVGRIGEAQEADESGRDAAREVRRALGLAISVPLYGDEI